MLRLTSVAVIVMLYSPMNVVSVKFAWNRSPPAVVSSTSLTEPLNVMLAVMLRIPTLSVMLAVIVTTSFWLNIVLFSGWKRLTFGAKVSFPTMKIISVSFLLEEVSFAMNLTV